MTEHEKKLIQARHRLEEAQMRDRDKERKARTRRLIQTGAILEKALPQARTMTTDELEAKRAGYRKKYQRRKELKAQRAAEASHITDQETDATA